MKSLFAFILLFSLLLSVNLSYGRKQPAGDYWKSVMKEQPMPKALSDLFPQESAASDLSAGASKMDHFVKDFDVKPTAILYHSDSHETNKNESQIKPDQN